MTAYDVQLVDVTKRFDGVTAVERFSLSIERGEFFSLLGPSGCGKTTTLRLIGGFETPDEGEIYIGGTRAAGLPPYRRNVNMVFQRLALFPHLNVFDNVAFGLRMRGVPRSEISQRVRGALRLVQLEGFESRRIHQLSGGQQQRVAIARALVNRPAVLLLDEPLASLDLQLRLQMQAELKRIQRESGTTFVYVTHDQTEALSMSTRIAVMRAGVIEQVGTPQEIYETPTTAFVAQFIGDANLLPVRVLRCEPERQRAVVDLQGMIGEFVSRARLEVGSRALLAVRHERLTLKPVGYDSNGQPQSGTFAFEARVVGLTYAGMYVRFEVFVPRFQQTLVAVQLAASTCELPSPGDAVWVQWTGRDAVVVAP